MFGVPLPPVHLSLLILARASWLAVSPSPVWPACVHSWVMVQRQRLQYRPQRLESWQHKTRKKVRSTVTTWKWRATLELMARSFFLPPSFDHVCQTVIMFCFFLAGDSLFQYQSLCYNANGPWYAVRMMEDVTDVSIISEIDTSALQQTVWTKGSWYVLFILHSLCQRDNAARLNYMTTQCLVFLKEFCVSGGR